MVLGAALTGLLGPPIQGEAAEPEPVELTIGVIPEALQFDPDSITVPAGAKVTLEFRNNGIMQHNLLVVTPGSSREVALEAMALSSDPQEHHYVPDSPLVLQATRLLAPDETETLKFTAPETPDDYPYVCTFPGHGFTMVGTMHVVARTEGAAVDDPEELSHTPAQPAETSEHRLTPVDKPRFIRTFIPPSAPRGVAVGLPSGYSYCFNTATCTLQYAWKGGFLDMEPVWTGRGGRPATVVGERFFEAPLQCPIRIGRSDAPPDRQFKGYKVIDGIPQFRYRVNGVGVRERITTPGDGKGLVRSIQIADTDRPVWYLMPPQSTDTVRIKASTGQPHPNGLKIAERGPVEFQVLILDLDNSNRTDQD